jgi:PAS domain S-box-containing protein
MNDPLRDSTFQWDNVVDAMEDCIFLLNADFKVVKTNKALREFLGKTDDEIIGKHCWELIHGTPEPPNFCQIAEMMKSKKRESSVITLAGKYVRVTMDPILDENGFIKGVVHVIRDIDEVEKRNILIQENEKKYHELVDTMNDVVFSLDFDGQVIDTSPSIKRIIGLSREELIGKRFSDYVHLDDLSRAEAEFINAIQDRGHPIELRVIQIDGTYRWVRVNALLIMRNGEPDNLLCVLSDIHDKRYAEELLRESEKKYHLLVDSASEAILVVQDGVIRLVNPMTITLTGVAEPELLSKSFASFIHPDDRAAATDYYQKQMRGEPVPARYAVRMVPKEGEIKWVEINPVLIEWEGRPATLGFVTDVTERKQAEERLRESEEKLRETNAILQQERDRAQHYLDDARTIIVNLDTNGKVTLINKKGCVMLGTSESEIVGKDWFENFLPEDTRTEIKRVFKEFISGNIEMGENYDSPILSAKGQIRMISWHNALIRDDSGKIISKLSVGEDITDRLQMEMNLKIATENLTRINTSLIDAKLRSQTYFDFLAHDIANILSPIMAYAELMSNNKQNPPEIVSFTEKIVDQAQKATSLIHNLRKLEMLEEKNLPEMNIVDIKRIFSFVENSIRHKYPEKKPTFIYHLPEDIPIKSRGGEYIDFVIRHVFDNAVRHAHKESVNIDVRIDKVGKKKGERSWRIVIEDDGPGISDRMKKEIITPLDPEKRYSRGVASSLAFCSAAVIGVGGELLIEDRVPDDQSKGTRVVVRIPVHD